MADIQLEGYIKRVLWDNPETMMTGVALSDVTIRSGELPPGVNETALAQSMYVAHVEDQSIGAKLSLEGVFEFNGKQYRFIANSSKSNLPDKVEHIETYVANGGVPRLGPSMGRLLVENFGAKALEVLEDSPEAVSLVIRGFSLEHIRSSVNGWLDKRQHQMRSEILETLKIPFAARVAMVRQWHGYTTEQLKDNPYQAARFADVDFRALDTTIRSLPQYQQEYGHPLNIKRVLGAVARTLDEHAAGGNTAMHAEKLVAKVAYLLNGMDPVNLARERIAPLIKRGYIAKIASDRGSLVQSLESESRERQLALDIRRLRLGGNPRLDTRGAEIIDVSPSGMHPAQYQAVRMVIDEPVSLIIGGPGSGKTTTIKSAIASLKAEASRQHRMVNILAVAPSGIAADRISQSAGIQAITAHAALEARRDGFFGRHRDNPLDADVIIIDEFGMKDLETAAALFESIPLGAKVIALGDADQLPSVGPGNVLGDIVASNRVPITKLTHDFRSGSEAARRNAAAVRDGQIIDYRQNGDGWEFSECESNIATFYATLSQFDQLVRQGVNPMNIAVLCSQHSGKTGTKSLNAHIQQAFQERGRLPFIETEHGRLQLYDRVVQKDNNRHLNVANGQVGRVIDLNASGAVVDYGRRNVTYYKGSLGQIELAWAMSIHKSQGSEYDRVILPIAPEHGRFYTRQKLFTAQTRMKEHVYVIGHPKTYEKAILNEEGMRRDSGLEHQLRAHLPPVESRSILRSRNGDHPPALARSL